MMSKYMKITSERTKNRKKSKHWLIDILRYPKL